MLRRRYAPRPERVPEQPSFVLATNDPLNLFWSESTCDDCGYPIPASSLRLVVLLTSAMDGILRFERPLFFCAGCTTKETLRFKLDGNEWAPGFDVKTMLRDRLWKVCVPQRKTLCPSCGEFIGKDIYTVLLKELDPKKLSVNQQWFPLSDDDTHRDVNQVLNWCMACGSKLFPAPGAVGEQSVSNPCLGERYWLDKLTRTDEGRQKAHTLPQDVQKALKREGFYAGPINGKWDDATSEAIQAYAEAKELLPWPTTIVDEDTGEVRKIITFRAQAVALCKVIQSLGVKLPKEFQTKFSDAKAFTQLKVKSYDKQGNLLQIYESKKGVWSDSLVNFLNKLVVYSDVPEKDLRQQRAAKFYEEHGPELPVFDQKVLAHLAQGMSEEETAAVLKTTRYQVVKVIDRYFPNEQPEKPTKPEKIIPGASPVEQVEIQEHVRRLRRQYPTNRVVVSRYLKLPLEEQLERARSAKRA